MTARDQISVGLSKIGLVLRHHAWSTAGPRDLSPTQAQVLALLRARGAGGMPVGEIAGELAITAPTASDSVAALARKNLVTKRRAQHDTRAVLVTLTRHGRAEAERCSAWPDALLGAADQLDADEQRLFVRALVKLVRSLQESGQIPVARMCVNCAHFRPNQHPDPAAPHHCLFVDAPFGDRELRMECREQVHAQPHERERLWQVFVGARGATGDAPAPRVPSRSPS